MRSEQAEKRGRTVRTWLQWMQEKVDEIQTPLIGAKTKDNRERLCREARAYGMQFENQEKECKQEVVKDRKDKSQEAAKNHTGAPKRRELQKQPVTRIESPALSYKELVFKADYLYEKQAYILALKLYEQCWEYAKDEVQQKILLVKLRRCVIQMKTALEKKEPKGKKVHYGENEKS